MLKLLDEKELRNFSIFIVWLINISGFFGILSDQKDFFLSSSTDLLSSSDIVICTLSHKIKSVLVLTRIGIEWQSNICTQW